MHAICVCVGLIVLYFDCIRLIQDPWEYKTLEEIWVRVIDLALNLESVLNTDYTCMLCVYVYMDYIFHLSFIFSKILFYFYEPINANTFAFDSCDDKILCIICYAYNLCITLSIIYLYDWNLTVKCKDMTETEHVRIFVQKTCIKHCFWFVCVLIIVCMQGVLKWILCSGSMNNSLASCPFWCDQAGCRKWMKYRDAVQFAQFNQFFDTFHH